MSEVQPIAPLIEQLGVSLVMGAHDHVTSMVAVCKIVDFETGATKLGVASSTGLDWIDKRGLIYTACELLADEKATDSDTDDD